MFRGWKALDCKTTLITKTHSTKMGTLLTDQDYKNFKQLLEYFVSYLEFLEATKVFYDPNKKVKVKELAKDVQYKDEDPRKRRWKDFVDKYGEELVPRSGQGYKGGSIQKGIKKWCDYNANIIGISVNAQNGYFSANSYLHWFDTQLNINIEPGKDNNGIITKLKITLNSEDLKEGNLRKVQEELGLFDDREVPNLTLKNTFNKEDLKEEDLRKSPEELGLFDGKDPNTTLKAFLDKYYSILKVVLKIEIKNLLKANHNVILTGAPGTGKTYLSKQIAKEIAGDKSRVGFVQFHPSYDYTDFVEGLRPVKTTDEGKNVGTIVFERKDGVFKKFCKEALSAPDDKYVFIIDEINRGELSKVFGELFFSIDHGYRGEDGRVKTQYQNLVEKGDEFAEGFYVPENVYIIGTMNDIDRSVESMDFAMRRRFAFKEITPESRVDMWDEADFGKKYLIDMLKRMKRLNEAIDKVPGLGSAYHIGPSYFLKLKECNKEELWDYYLKGLVFEYLRGMPDADKYLKDIKDAYDNKGNEKSEEDISD